MKKILVWALSVVLVLVACTGAMAVFAEDNYTEDDVVVEAPILTVGTVSGKPGDTVTVPVTLENNPGIFSFTMSIEYDTTRLNLTNASINVAGLGGSQTIGKRLVWLGDDADSTFNGEIIYLTFEILADAAEGEAAVSAFYAMGDMCNYDEEDVMCEFIAGGVIVGDDSTHTHTPAESVVENQVAPECDLEGSYDNVVYCSECGELISRETIVVDALEHEPVDAGVVTAPTCTGKGYTTHTCSVCGERYIEDEVAALGHAYEAVVTDPTCTEKGYTTYTCSPCGDSYTEDEVDALGHTEEIVPGVPATETETGLTEGKKCSVCDEILEAQQEIPALGVEEDSTAGEVEDTEPVEEDSTAADNGDDVETTTATTDDGNGEGDGEESSTEVEAAGCKGVIASAAVLGVVALAAGVVIRKKKD